jgi:hypothetical protein
VVWGDEERQLIGFAVVLCFSLAVHVLDGGNGLAGCTVDDLYKKKIACKIMTCKIKDLRYKQ